VLARAFLDGVDTGKSETVQAGFDTGFVAAAANGFQWGRSDGILRYGGFFLMICHWVGPLLPTSIAMPQSQ